MYTNEHMTIWRELIAKYETSLLFAAETAHQLVHIVQARQSINAVPARVGLLRLFSTNL